MIYPKINIIFLTILIVCFNYSAKAQNRGVKLFNNSFLHQIKFESATISEDALWNNLDDTYTLVDMTIDGELVDSVGIRRKGYTSNASPQKPIKIDINRFISSKKYDGLKKFNLHNNFKDDFLQRERLAYDLYRRAGLPSPRTSYAEVYFGDNFVGLYLVVEQIDKTFLKHNFPSDNGSLIKAEPPGIVPGTMLEVKEGTMNEFNNFRNNVTCSNLGTYVNLRNYLKQMAVDIIIEDWDGYAYNRHNFYVYYEPKSGLLNFINYDHNYAFAVDEPNKYLYPIATFPTSVSFLEDPVLKSMYEETLCELLSYLLDSDYISDQAHSNYDLLNLNTNGIKAQSPDAIIQYISERKRWLQDTLSNLNIHCEEVTYPLNVNDIVINEFVASSDSIGGVQEPDGGTPDWIELYNNSSNDIVLNDNYYLSDDIHFPKKWYFPEEVTIHANDYLIVWADKDVHQQGVHAGFKIEKDGGNILLTYENTTEVQSVNYDNQFLNKAFARVPNGTGDFRIQEPTFNVNNENAVGIKDAKKSELLIYPNPVNDLIWIPSNQEIKQIAIYSISGKQLCQYTYPAFPLNLGAFEPGIYFLKIDLGSYQQMQRLIIKT